MAVLAHRENFNAHSFEVLTLYLKSGPAPGTWHLVPVFDRDRERLELTISGGADCLLHDFRLVREGKGHPLRLLVADRALDASFADADAVTFTSYVLRINREETPGSPRFFFERERQFPAKARYCDVGEAFRRELGLGDWRKGDWKP